MKHLFLYGALIASMACRGQQEWQSYLSDWTKAGMFSRKFQPAKIIRLSPHADTSVSVNAEIAQAIRSFDDMPGMILLSEGKYLLTGTVHLPSNVAIKGMGPGKTIVYIQNQGRGHGFSVEGGLTGKRFPVEPLNRVDRTVHLRDKIPENIRWIRWIREDADLCRDSWCRGMTGQFFLSSA